MQADGNSIVDVVSLQRDLYIVLSLLLADEAVAGLGGRFRWTGDFNEREVRRLLLRVAVAVRSLSDSAKRAGIGAVEQSCGEYWENYVPGKVSSDLTLRQACNSIIHSEEILSYDVDKKTKPRPLYSNCITVRGSHRSKPTRAKIDIIKFAESANILINICN